MHPIKGSPELEWHKKRNEFKDLGIRNSKKKVIVCKHTNGRYQYRACLFVDFIVVDQYNNIRHVHL